MPEASTSRQRFEAWVTAPPYERQVRRFPENDTLTAWPGQYRDLAVQLAWEAWQQAEGEREKETEKHGP